MMRYKAISILCSLLVHYKVNANEQNESQYCKGRTKYFFPSLDDKPIHINYDVDSDYCWMINASNDDYRVRIKFSRFSLTRGYDFLDITDLGDDEISKNSLLAKFSGGNLPNDVISVSHGMWMKLRIQTEISSHRLPSIAFSIQAERREVDITLPCPTVSPHNLTYPKHNGNYSNNGYRLWRVTTEPPCTITMMMTSLKLEGGRDFVFVSEGTRASFGRLNWFNFTGEMTQSLLSKNPYRTQGSNLIIIFTSDYSKGKPGFSLYIVANSSDGTIIKGKPTTEYMYPTQTQTWPTTLWPIKFSYQGQKNEMKFYLIVTGIPAIAIAALAFLLIFVVRCYVSKLNTQPARPISSDTRFSIPRSDSTTSSLSRFFFLFRHHDGPSFSDSFSSGTLPSTFSSGRYSFSSSLYSDYTASMSLYRSSRIRNFLDSRPLKDSFPSSRSTSSGSQLTTFHPKTSQDEGVVDVSEGTSTQSNDNIRSSRISWRMIRNAFWNGSSRSPASSVRSTSIQERVTRWSTGSYIQDTDSSVPMETSSSTDSESISVMSVAQRNSLQTMNNEGKLGAEGNGSYRRSQTKMLFTERLEGQQINEGGERKVAHTYFKGLKRLSSSSTLPSFSGRPLPPIPPRRRYDDKSTPVNLVAPKKTVSSNGVPESIEALSESQEGTLKRCDLKAVNDDQSAIDTESESPPVIRAAPRKSLQAANGDEKSHVKSDGDYPRIQPETLFTEKADKLQINQVVERKVTHIYFKGCSRLGSGSKLSNVSGRPLPPVPPRRRYDDNMIHTLAPKRPGPDA